MRGAPWPGRPSDPHPLQEADQDQGSPVGRQSLTGPSMIGWAQRLIAAAGGDLPSYGSSEWHALPDNDRRKVASCVAAAEAWRGYTDPAEVALRLRLELDAARAEGEDARWTPEVVAAVHRTASQPTHAELSGRRGEPERAKRARAHERRMDLLLSREHPVGGAS